MNYVKVDLYLSVENKPYVFQDSFQDKRAAYDEAEALILVNKRNRVLLVGGTGHEYLYRGCPQLKR
ncbi:hypothetical protein DXP75_12370 [Listeria monocytogenes]|nr:hypothetical protein [Listeria monocytogenes]EAC2921691.1 hypothetical protein [Listeria monocytogenes]EAC3423702.1 hypothetical protein [Listeria monocytogenes]EAC4360110.1 hypothetical protein [Listeria monocytogenes]EAC5149928.1 hypothetical protein [Listeria monocytogenes]